MIIEQCNIVFFPENGWSNLIGIVKVILRKGYKKSSLIELPLKSVQGDTFIDYEDFHSDDFEFSESLKQELSKRVYYRTLLRNTRKNL